MSEKVLININKIGKSVDDAIKEELVKNNLPTCFGHAYPSVLNYNREFDLDAISEHKKEGPASSISMLNIISNNSTGVYQDRVVTSAGIDIIEAAKAVVAKSFADQLAKCNSCELFNKCSEITKNYAQAVSMNLVLKMKDN